MFMPYIDDVFQECTPVIKVNVLMYYKNTFLRVYDINKRCVRNMTHIRYLCNPQKRRVRPYVTVAH